MNKIIDIGIPDILINLFTISEIIFSKSFQNSHIAYNLLFLYIVLIRPRDFKFSTINRIHIPLVEFKIYSEQFYL